MWKVCGGFRLGWIVREMLHLDYVIVLRMGIFHYRFDRMGMTDVRERERER